MAFQSRRKRETFTQLGTWFAFDAAISFGLAYLIDADEWLFVGLVILALLTFFPLLLIIKNAVFKGMWNWFVRDEMVSRLKASFSEARLPAPNSSDVFADLDDYLVQVESRDDAPMNARLFAARTLGELQSINRYSFIDAFTIRSAAERALDEYQQENNGDSSVYEDNEADIEDEEELKRAEKVKFAAEVGLMSARNLSEDNPAEMREYERKRYEQYRDKIEKLLDEMYDDFYKAFATHQYIRLVVAAGEVERAKERLSLMPDVSMIEEKILEEFPQLRDT